MNPSPASGAIPNLVTDYPELRGIFIGGCVERGVGSSFRAQAHAHIDGDDPFKGFVCVRSQRRLFTASGSLSQLMLHEIAHVLTGHGHDDVWRRKAREMGYRLPKRYLKKGKP